MKYCGRSPAVVIAGLLLVVIIATLASRSAFPAQTASEPSAESSSSSSSAEFILPIVDVDWRSEEGVAVFYFLQRSIIGGYPAPDGDPQKATFRGHEPISRAEVAKLLFNAARIPITETRNNGRFLDVAEGEWYTPYVLTAAKRGIVQGYPPRHILFAHRNPVTTAEFLKMLTLTFELRERQRHGFRDVPADAWFAPYAGAAWQYGLFPERVDHLQPGRPLARRDVILALYHLFTVKRPRGVSEWFAPNIPGIPIDTIPMHAPSFTGKCPPTPICPPPPKPECSYKVELDRNDCAISCGTLDCPNPQSSASSVYQQSSAVSSASSTYQQSSAASSVSSTQGSSASATVANANPDPPGSPIPPEGTVFPFGFFRFLQPITDSPFVFSITADDLEMSSLDFKIYNQHAPSLKQTCSAANTVLTAFLVSCPNAYTAVGDVVVIEGKLIGLRRATNNVLQASFQGVPSTKYRN